MTALSRTRTGAQTLQRPALRLAAGLLGLALLAGAAHAQRPPASPGATDALAMFDGVWIGPASYRQGDQTFEFEQMERIGPMLAGEIRVMEGKARGPQGETLFQALTVFSPAEGGGIVMRSWTPGDVSERVIEMKPDGYVWETQAGPSRTRYDITIADGVWHETGVSIAPGEAPVPFFEMTLTRVGDTDWPHANPDFPTTD